MNHKRIWRNFILIVAFSVFLAFVDNPWKLPKLETEIPVITPVWNWMQESTMSLGLDLQGGTQLDYQIDLRDARARNEDEDPDNDIDIDALLSGVKDVIERRVDSLGVSEPNIYLSSAGEEQHIVVELPGVDDLQQAKDRVGKVVQLEFKTEKGEPSEADIAAVRDRANDYFKQVRSEDQIDDLEAYMEDDIIPDQIEYKLTEEAYIDELPEEFRDVIKRLEPGQFHRELIRSQESSRIQVAGQVYQPEGFNIIRLKEEGTELRKNPQNAEPFADVLTERGGTPSETLVSPEAIEPAGLRTEVETLETGEISSVVETDQGFYIAQVTEKLPIDYQENPQPQVDTSHILFKTESLLNKLPIKDLVTIPEDATAEEQTTLEERNAQIETENDNIRKENADIAADNAEITTKNEEKKALAEDILAQLKEDPSRFEELARQYSEDGSAENGGNLGYSNPSNFVKPFSDAALALEPGQMTDELVQSQFGYHIIKLIDLKPADEERFQYDLLQVCYEGAEGCESTVSKEDARAEADALLTRVREETTYTVERAWFNALPDPWEKTELDGRYFKRASVAYDQSSFVPYVAVEFDSTGADLFAEITGENVQKRIGIFVGGEFISAPVVQQRITGGTAQITMGVSNPQIALQQANDLSQSLNAGSIPAPLKKPNELNIGASLGADSLQKSLHAGLLGLVLVAVFMLLVYRFLGILASASLIVYGLFLTFIIQSQVPPLLAVIITFGMWVLFALSLFRSKLDGLAKALFLLFSVLGVMFVFTVLVNPIVMTLAGVSGLILSIGMAVDANILIFERIKEEFAQGKSFLASVNDGFERAWSSILDSNVSSLITCAILFFFGTSIIKGFAINLAVGIVISMYTAITVTKTFLLLFEGTKLEKIDWLWKRKR